MRSSRRSRTTRSMRAPPGRTTSTAWCATTSCARQPNQADIQVNLLSRHDRNAQSHEIARRLRPELDKSPQPFGARIKVAEVPPGPPVLQTLVAEVYGPDYKGQIELAAQIKKIFQQTPGRRGRGLVRRRSADQVRHESGSGQSRAAWHLCRRRYAHVAGRTERAQMPACCTIPNRAKTCRSRCAWRGRIARASQDLGNLKLPTPSGGTDRSAGSDRRLSRPPSTPACIARICSRSSM